MNRLRQYFVYMLFVLFPDSFGIIYNKIYNPLIPVLYISLLIASFLILCYLWQPNIWCTLLLDNCLYLCLWCLCPPSSWQFYFLVPWWYVFLLWQTVQLGVSVYSWLVSNMRDIVSVLFLTANTVLSFVYFRQAFYVSLFWCTLWNRNTKAIFSGSSSESSSDLVLLCVCVCVTVLSLIHIWRCRRWP